MEPELDPDLEAIVDQELRKLPPLRAPATLLPRVMAAVQTRLTLHWWQRAWWDWPRAAQAAFLAVSLAVAALVTNSGLMLDRGVQTYSEQLVDGVSTLWRYITPLVNVLALLLEKAQPLLIPALVAAAILYLMFLGCGTIFVRVVKRCAV